MKTGRIANDNAPGREPTENSGSQRGSQRDKEGAGEDGKSIKPSKVEECGGVSKLEAVDVVAGGPSVRWVRTNLPGATSTNFGGPLLRVL